MTRQQKRRRREPAPAVVREDEIVGVPEPFLSSKRADMETFDNLPVRIREAIANIKFDIPAEIVRRALLFGTTEDEIIRSLAERDARIIQDAGKQ